MTQLVNSFGRRFMTVGLGQQNPMISKGEAKPNSHCAFLSAAKKSAYFRTMTGVCSMMPLRIIHAENQLSRDAQAIRLCE
jgi:hypothetical protein